MSDKTTNTTRSVKGVAIDTQIETSNANVATGHITLSQNDLAIASKMQWPWDFKAPIERELSRMRQAADQNEREWRDKGWGLWLDYLDTNRPMVNSFQMRVCIYGDYTLRRRLSAEAVLTAPQDWHILRVDLQIMEPDARNESMWTVNCYDAPFAMEHIARDNPHLVFSCSVADERNQKGYTGLFRDGDLIEWKERAIENVLPQPR